MERLHPSAEQQRTCLQLAGRNAKLPAGNSAHKVKNGTNNNTAPQTPVKRAQTNKTKTPSTTQAKQPKPHTQNQTQTNKPQQSNPQKPKQFKTYAGTQTQTNKPQQSQPKETKQSKRRLLEHWLQHTVLMEFPLASLTPQDVTAPGSASALPVCTRSPGRATFSCSSSINFG